MKNISTIFFIFFITISSTWAWDFGMKADGQISNTDNVNLTKAGPISDNYSTLGGYIQTKNDNYKFKLKAKTEIYKKQTENDNYSADLSAQYKVVQEGEFTIGAFKQVYNGNNIVSTDTTSDNSGARFSGSLYQTFNKDTSGYFSLNGNVKKYSKIANRSDKIISGTYGIEHNFSSQLMINPELTIQNNNSAESYYSNFSYGPSLIISITPNDDWEYFVNGSIAKTNYSDRTVTVLVKNRKLTNKEYQELISVDAGVIYSFAKILSLQGKYSIGKNNSNNSSSAYKANVLSVDFAIRI
ncbi:MAG: hypothetical protein Q7U04_05810 [Bacteriovorax sp.]|nr:hypothetical protein [Bacteriovorax sp.]